MEKEFTRQWDCPTYMFSGNAYPPVLSGPGYIMSRQASRCLYTAALKIPYFHMEDVYITGFAAEMCNIERTHVNGFHNLNNEFDHAVDHINHYTNPDQMKSLFAQMPKSSQ